MPPVRPTSSTFQNMAARLEAVAQSQPAPSGQQGELPKDSIDGAIRALFHTLIDAVAGGIPKNLQTTSHLEREGNPVAMYFGGRNSQGLPTALHVQVALDPSIQGVQIQIRMVVSNEQGVPVANPAQTFSASRQDSMREVAKQVSTWIGQSETLQMAPVGTVPPQEVQPQQPVPAPQARPAPQGVGARPPVRMAL